MTKSVRIENADTSSYRVLVQVWRVCEGGDDVLDHEEILSFPTQMCEKLIFKEQYLVVKECS